jgi:hypothetical protein
MHDEKYTTPCEALRSDCFKEAVCINANRVYDACRDRECIDALRVYFVQRDQEIIDNAISVRLKDTEVMKVFIDTEPVQFNRGYYTVDITIYFCVTVDVAVSPVGCPCELRGVCVYNKKAVLYGSEGSVKVFSSDFVADEDDIQNSPEQNLPKATVSIAEPVSLGANLVGPDSCDCNPCGCGCGCGCMPSSITNRFAGSFVDDGEKQLVEVTIGIFMIIQLERQVQMLIPVYDFCMPEKVCTQSSASPCDMFNKIKFPASEFFPPSASNDCGCDDAIDDVCGGGCDCGCGCGR